jgi:hypothetical protein
MTSDIDDEMKRALARYTGPVTRCHPGNARGKRVKVKPPVQDRPVNVGHERRHLKADDVARWLTQHDEDALSAEHQRARRRKEREERVRRAHLHRHDAKRMGHLATERGKSRMHVDTAPGGKWAVVDGANKVLAQFATNDAAWAWMLKRR